MKKNTQENNTPKKHNQVENSDQPNLFMENTRFVRKKSKATDSHLRLQAFINSEEAKKYLQK